MNFHMVKKSIHKNDSIFVGDCVSTELSGHAKVLLREGKAKANQARTDKFTEGSTALKNGSRRTGALSGENQTQHLIAKGGEK